MASDFLLYKKNSFWGFHYIRFSIVSMFDLFFELVRVLTQLNYESELRNKERIRRMVNKRAQKERQGERERQKDKKERRQKYRKGGGSKNTNKLEVGEKRKQTRKAENRVKLFQIFGKFKLSTRLTCRYNASLHFFALFATIKS